LEVERSSIVFQMNRPVQITTPPIASPISMKGLIGSIEKACLLPEFSKAHFASLYILIV
jgi:hypothetical protein